MKPKHKTWRKRGGKKNRGRADIVAYGRNTRWKPGQSGNPSGRPKSKIISEAMRKKAELEVPDDSQGRTYAELLADAAYGHAASGKAQYLTEILNRNEGRPVQPIIHSGTIGLSIEEIDEKLKRFFDRARERARLQAAQSQGAGGGDGTDGGSGEPSGGAGGTG